MEELRKAPWPGWETVQLIGRGSFGAVYEIQRELVDGTTESAAMKVITIPQNPEDISEMYGEGYDDESITASFRAHLKSIVAEYTLMRKLDGSANAVNCKDISYVQHPDGIGWDIYIRMELLTPLVKSLSGSTSEETVLKIGRDICSALVLCKKYDIVHRDIKPQNIFISPNGDYKLGDFGIAKTVEKTMGGTKVGTYKYMAPEVYNNQPYGSGADIYSLGLVLYWLLNERRMPFMPLPPARVLAGQDEEARQRRLSGEPLPPPVHGSAELKKIVLKACAYAPEARFRSAEEMYEALCRCSRIPASAPAEQQSTAQPADRQQDTLDPSPLAPPPPVFEPTVIDNTSAEPEPAPAVHANDPKQRQQVPVQQGHVQKKEEAKKEPPEKKQKKPAGRGITAIITGILLLSCCVLGVYGYMHCWFGHVWQAADCTTGRVCTRCSAVAEEPLGHLWQDATCTTPKTCSRCGAAEGKALGHKWEAATCTAPKTCSRCSITSGKALGHTWEAATCTTPKTCSRCETTEGKALGHSWEAATCTTPKTCSRCGAIEGKALGHSWKAATCTTPKTCSRCKATEGKALGHSWKAATCTAPKTCSRCKVTEGKALGHKWEAATCTTKMTCKKCGQTSGAALGHKWKAATYDAPKTCTVCGATTGEKLELPIYGLGMTLEEFEKQSTSLLKEAKSWTYGTAPQNLNDFPLFPNSLSRMVEAIKGAKSKMEISGSTVTWETNLPTLLRVPKTGFEWTEMSFEYTDLSQNARERPKFDSGKNNKYTIQVPEKAWAYGSSPQLFFFGNRYWKGWNETFHVAYNIQNKRIDGVSYIGLYMFDSEYSISWSYNFDGSSNLSIDIYSYSSGRIWYLTYDLTSGNLLRMSR